MATVQKTISESGLISTKTLTTMISTPGIRQDAVISVSPSIDASKISYTINEVDEITTVTLANVTFTSSGYANPAYYTGELSHPTNPSLKTCFYSDGSSYDTSVNNSCASAVAGSEGFIYYFKYTIIVTYDDKVFPEFKVRQNGQLKTASDGWVRVNGQLRQIQQMWARVNGNLKEV